MAPAKGLAEYKDKFVTDRFIGTGPYRLLELVGTDRVVLEVNPGYWGPRPSPIPPPGWRRSSAATST